MHDQRTPHLYGGAETAEIPDDTIAIVASNEIKLAVRLGQKTLPDFLGIEINGIRSHVDHLVARLGPDEWFLITDSDGGQSIRHEIAALPNREFHSIVDVSHRTVGIEVQGRNASKILNGGCPLNLSDRAFPPGSATRTIFGKAEVILMRPARERVYRMEVSRSFAPYAQDLLLYFAREHLVSDVSDYCQNGV